MFPQDIGVGTCKAAGTALAGVVGAGSEQSRIDESKLGSAAAGFAACEPVPTPAQ